MVKPSMGFMQRRHKAAVLVNTIIVGLLTIAVIAFFYYLLISKLYEIHTVTKEYETERHAINLANVLISSKQFAYEKDGKIYRGILNASKLDAIMYKKSDFLSKIKASLEPKDIGIGYPNSYAIVEVIDLDSCNKDVCDGWVCIFQGPAVAGLNLKKFAVCLGEKVTQNTITEFWFKWHTDVGKMYNLFHPFGDIRECATRTAPASLKDFFSSGTLISRIGLPVNIWYPNGEIHAGRIIVGVAEWW